MNWLKRLWFWFFPPIAPMAVGPIFNIMRIRFVNGSGETELDWPINNGVTLPNVAADNVIVVSGYYMPFGPNDSWWMSFKVDGNEYPITAQDGSWASSIPVGVCSPNSIAILTIAASCNARPCLGNTVPHTITFTGN